MGHRTTIVVEGKGDVAEPISRPYRGDIRGINRERLEIAHVHDEQAVSSS